MEIRELLDRTKAVPDQAGTRPLGSEDKPWQESHAERHLSHDKPYVNVDALPGADPTDRTTRAEAVQAAIDHAVNNLIPDGLNPTVLLPSEYGPSAGGYETNNVSYDSRVSITPEGSVEKWVDPYSFGAAGDGQADDFAAVQRAHEYAADNGYGLYLPPGDFLLGKCLGLTGPKAIIKAHQQAKITAPGTVDPFNADGHTYLIDVDDNSPPDYLYIEGLHAVGNGIGNAPAGIHPGPGTKLGHIKACRLEDFDLSSGGIDGALDMSTGLGRMVVFGNIILRSAAGISTTNPTHRACRIIGNWIDGDSSGTGAPDSIGIGLQNGHGHVVKGNFVRDCQILLRSPSAPGCIVSGNVFEEAFGYSGVRLGSERIVCNGNIMRLCDAAGLRIGADNCRAAGNVVYGNGTNDQGGRSDTDRAGVRILSGVTGSVVKGLIAVGNGDQTWPVVDEGSVDCVVEVDRATGHSIGDHVNDTGATNLTVHRSRTPRSRVTNSAALTIPNATWTGLTFDTERFDSLALHDTASNTSRMTAPEKGVYKVSANVEWDGDADGDRIIRIRKNGSVDVARDRIGSFGSTTPAPQAIETQVEMAQGDYLEVEVWHNAGNDLDVRKSGEYSPEFAVVKVG